VVIFLKPSPKTETIPLSLTFSPVEPTARTISLTANGQDCCNIPSRSSPGYRSWNRRGIVCAHSPARWRLNRDKNSRPLEIFTAPLYAPSPNPTYLHLLDDVVTSLALIKAADVNMFTL